jgi:hypothetical protein
VQFNCNHFGDGAFQEPDALFDFHIEVNRAQLGFELSTEGEQLLGEIACPECRPGDLLKFPIASFRFLPIKKQ